MHELSIAISIVEMASEEAESRGANRVDAVYLRLGVLSGVVPQALLASYELACENTPLSGSRLLIEDVPVAIFCGVCRDERSIATRQAFVCDVCGTPCADVVRGKEIEVTALELVT